MNQSAQSPSANQPNRFPAYRPMVTQPFWSAATRVDGVVVISVEFQTRPSGDSQQPKRYVLQGSLYPVQLQFQPHDAVRRMVERMLQGVEERVLLLQQEIEARVG